MTSHSPCFPRGPRKPSPGPHRRRRPSTPFEAIDWSSLRSPFRIGLTPDATVAKSLGCHPADVARYRLEHGIEAPGTEGDGGRWPSDAELTRQNEAAGERREAELRWEALMSSSGAWMDGRMGVDDED